MIDPPHILPTLRTLPTTVRTTITTAGNNCAASAIDYLATGWPGTSPVTSWGGDLEQHIRPPACNAFGLAVLLSQGVYDPAVSGQSAATATAAVIRYVDGLARTHTANGGTWGGDPVSYDGAGFPRAWQCAMWAAFAGTAAALMWSDLSTTQQDQVKAMMAAEADRFTGVTAPSARDRSGRVIWRADTKAEEVVWNAFAPSLAAALMPGDARANAWWDSMITMSVAATSVPSDVTSTRALHGRKVRDVVTGSNLDLGGIVENHGYVFPNYTTAAALGLLNGLVYAVVGGSNVPAATLHNADHLYYAMTDVAFTSPPHNSPGGTVYQPGSYAIYYPASNEGDPDRMASYLAMDCLVHCFAVDTRSIVKAATWAGLHADRQLALQVATPGARRGYWDLSHLAMGLLADRVIAARPQLVVSNSSTRG